MVLKPRWKRFGIASASVGLTVAGLVYVSWRNRPLLNRATRYPVGAIYAYAWQSDGGLIAFPGDGKSKTIPVRIDRERKTQTPLPGYGNDPNLILHDSEISPDGHWMASLATTGASSPACFALALDTPRRLDWAEPFVWDSAPVGIAWLPDSRRWLGMILGHGGYGLGLYSLDVPESRGRPVPFPNGATKLLGVTSDYRAVLSEDYTQANGAAVALAVKLFVFGLLPNATPAQTFALRVPAGVTARDIQLSPKGDRLAWTLSSTHESSFRKTLARLIPFAMKPPTVQQSVALWVSRLDGKEMRLIGEQGVDPKASNEDGPHDVRWTPDGIQLSFLNGHTLYTVPAE